MKFCGERDLGIASRRLTSIPPRNPKEIAINPTDTLILTWEQPA